MSNKEFIHQLYKNNKQQVNLPDKELTFKFVDGLFDFLFIPRTGVNKKENEIEKGLYSFKSHLTTLIYDVLNDSIRSQEAAEKFFEQLPDVYETLQKDAKAFVDNDPAALSATEVLSAYPGFYAIAVYRMANLLWAQEIKALARMFTEYAHSKTGVDIHPGASIGEAFFIDHGTGVVIGETAILGNNIKIYQGVTIGAFNSSKNKKGTRRHPQIEDNVIIYSGASILGGDTLIGENSVIGANVWITHSVLPSSLVYHKSEVVKKEQFSHKDFAEKILNKD